MSSIFLRNTNRFPIVSLCLPKNSETAYSCSGHRQIHICVQPLYNGPLGTTGQQGDQDGTCGWHMASHPAAGAYGGLWKQAPLQYLPAPASEHPPPLTV